MASDFLARRAPITQALTAVGNVEATLGVQLSADLDSGRLVSCEYQQVSSANSPLSIRVRAYRLAAKGQLETIVDFLLDASSTPALPADGAGAVVEFDDLRFFDAANVFVTLITDGATKTVTGHLLWTIDPDTQADPVRAGGVLPAV